MPKPIVEHEYTDPGDPDIAVRYERDAYGARLSNMKNGRQWHSIPVDRNTLILLQSIIEQALGDDGLK